MNQRALLKFLYSLVLHYSLMLQPIPGQDLWVKLNEVEMANNMLCPYQSLTMICKHPSTLNQPDWVVFNNTDVIFRSVNFQSGQLPNHSIVYDTNSEEVLMIHSLLPEFDGLMYYCLYDTINGEVRSNNLTVDIPDVPQVEEFEVERISDSVVVLSWRQIDPCQQTASFKITAADKMGMELPLHVFVSASETSQFYSTLLTLSMHTQYTLSIVAVANDTRISDPTTADYPVIRTEFPATICNSEPHTCILFAASAVLLVVVIVTLLALIIYLLKGRTRRK
jgi:hypothetical protein